GGLDYGWAENRVDVPGEMFCSTPPNFPIRSTSDTEYCFEENNNNIDDPSITSDDDNDLSVGRIATLIHDAFDGHSSYRDPNLSTVPERGLGAPQPNNADVCALSVI